MVKVGNHWSATSQEIFKSKMVNPMGRFSAQDIHSVPRPRSAGHWLIVVGESRPSSAELWSLGTNQLNLASL